MRGPGGIYHNAISTDTSQSVFEQCCPKTVFFFWFCPKWEFSVKFFWRASRAKNLHFLTAVLEFLAIFRFSFESNFLLFLTFYYFFWKYFWNRWFSGFPSGNFHYDEWKKKHWWGVEDSWGRFGSSGIEATTLPAEGHPGLEIGRDGDKNLGKPSLVVWKTLNYRGDCSETV